MKANNYTIISQQFNDISLPWRQKYREPLPTALYPISRYSGARYKGGHCISKRFEKNNLKYSRYLEDGDSKSFSTVSNADPQVYTHIKLI